MLELQNQLSFTVHESASRLCEVYEQAGYEFSDYLTLDHEADLRKYRSTLMILPPMLQRSKLLKKSYQKIEAFASGWMNIRGMKRRRALEQGFVISDHADWPALIKTIRETKAQKVFVTHGYNDILARYVKETLNIEAEPLDVLRKDEEESL